jgi:hypothetical protein
MTTPADQLENLTSGWRQRHGPEVQRRRATVLVETISIAFEDGRIAELTRKAGEDRYTVTRDPDERRHPIDAPPPVQSERRSRDDAPVYGMAPLGKP